MGHAQIMGKMINMVNVMPGPPAGIISSIPKAPAATRQYIIKTILETFM
jgi:hypothetical protein